MLLMVLVKAPTMESLVNKCNMLVLKGGISYNFSPPLTDGKQFYTTYYVDTESSAVFRKVAEVERRNTTKK